MVLNLWVMALLSDASGKAGCNFVSIHELMKINLGWIRVKIAERVDRLGFQFLIFTCKGFQVCRRVPV